MSTVGLYSIDLWHNRHAVLDFELMKVYNYHYNRNDRVIMMRPEDNEGRFDKIIYFKDKEDSYTPKNHSLSGPNKEIYGYGFFKAFYPLDEMYKNEPPCYLPFDPYIERFTLSVYNKIKKSSYIRLENEDFSDFSKDERYITFADHNLLYVPGAESFIKEYKNHDFIAIHKLEIKDESTFLKFIPYSSLINRNLFIDYHFSKEIFMEYYKDKVIFNWITPWEQENLNHFLVRIISMILYYKINNVPLKILKTPIDKFHKYIVSWGIKNNQLSYYQFYSDNKEAISYAEQSPSEIRTLLKSNPSKMKSSDIDFNHIL